MGGVVNLALSWWTWAMVAVVCVLLAICAVLKLHEANIYLLREMSKVIRCPWFETALLLFFVGGLVQYGATKGTNGTSGVCGDMPSGGLASAILLHPGEATNDFPAVAMFRIDAFDVTSTNIALSVAWPMDFFSAPTTIDLFGSVSLTNRFEWLESAYFPEPCTNCNFCVSFDAVGSTNRPPMYFFKVSERQTAASTMEDFDGDGLPGFYELANGTNPYLPDADRAYKIVCQDNDIETLNAALRDSVPYSIVALPVGTTIASKPIRMPPHPVILSGPTNGYAVIRSSADIGAFIFENGQDSRTLIRNVYLVLEKEGSFQVGFWCGGNLPWEGLGASPTFENIVVRMMNPGTEYIGWLCYRNNGETMRMVNCLVNAAGTTYVRGVETGNGPIVDMTGYSFLNATTNSPSTMMRTFAHGNGGTTNAVVRMGEAQMLVDLSSGVDSDGDGISNADEVEIYKTDPWLADSDGDFVGDAEEIAEGTDPTNRLSHIYYLDVSVVNTIIYEDITNYVFTGACDGWQTNVIFTCAGAGGTTNLPIRSGAEGLSVSAFRDLNRDGAFDPAADVVSTVSRFGSGTVKSATFRFGDMDGDGVDDVQERADGTDPCSRLSLKISRMVKISNADSNATITNYYAIAQSHDAADAQWVRMTSDQLAIPVSQRTESGCLYALVYRDLNGNGVYEEGVDALCDRNSFASGSTEFTVSFGDADGDTISDSCELREETDPLDRWSYCYQVLARVTGVFATTNQLTCSASFGTNEILAATIVTNSEFAADLGHHSTANGETVTLWFWDDANSNLVRDVGETCTSISIRPNGHEVSYEGTLSTSAFDRDYNGLMDWWEAETGLSGLNESHKDADDNDHDGLINLHEYWAGTDPLTPDGSSTALWALAQSIDERLASVQTTNDVLDVYVDYYQNGTNGVFVRNQNCWMCDLDLSCLSVWNSSGEPHSHGGTAITKKHILWAKHWYLGSGSRLDFVGTNGVIYSRIVDKVRFISVPGVSENDISIASLTEELPDSVIPARVLDQNACEKIMSGRYLPVVTINQDKRAFVQEVSKIAFGGDRSCTVTYQRPKDALRVAFSGNIRGGDSGGPTFFIYNGRLILVGAHWKVGVDSSFPMALKEIRSAVNALASGYEIETEDFGTNEVGGAASE